MNEIQITFEVAPQNMNCCSAGMEKMAKELIDGETGLWGF